MKSDVLSILEAIYAEAPDEHTWLQTVVDVAEPLLDTGFGLGAHSYSIDGDNVAFGSFCAGASGRATVSRLLPTAGSMADAIATAPGMSTRVLSQYPYADSFMRVARRGPDTDKPAVEMWTRFFAQVSARDMMGVIGGNPSHCGVVLFAPSPSLIRRAPETLAMWTRVAAHLAAGHRLRAAGSVEPDAVLEPAGRVAHMGPGVSAGEREELALGVRAIDRARGKLRRVDPGRALSLWRGLVAGRWSLVDQFDHDGRRYVLARRNPPGVRAWRKLTARETEVLEYAAHGQPHKVIAYELGISVASVGAHLANAASKVGVRSRLELVAAYKRRGTPVAAMKK